MANINLATDREEGGSLGSGTMILIGVLALSILIYLGLFFYEKKLGDDMTQLTTNYDAKLNNFISGDSKRVLDFQNRLTISTELLAQERDGEKDIEIIEGAMIVGVYLDSYKYDNTTKAITLDCYAPDYATVAKQILSFKRSDSFLSVSAGVTTFDAKSSRIKFPVVLTVK